MKGNILFLGYLILLIIIPISLGLWFTSHIFSNFFGTIKTTPLRWLLGILIPFIFSVWGYKRKSLSLSGAITGYFVGFVITLSNYAFLICLIVFFVSSSKATKFKQHFKRKMDPAFKEGGQRNWVQVMCNGSVAMVVAFLYILECGFSEQFLDFNNNYRCSWLSAALLGSFCCSNGDTWASELGPVLSESDPRLITNFKVVPRGTNGGVTIVGTLMSLFGGLVVAAGFWLCTSVLASSPIYYEVQSQWPILIVGAIAGFYGSLVDSLLGAKYQYSGLDEDGHIVERSSNCVKHISGIDLLNNHTVNLISNIITTFTTPHICIFIFDMFS